ncbi:MAG TPA: Crp/Fnr family transcriptional regulator [Candidatus Acidoferrales bacterium]|nr:Crp/Fnr family transcriptional regulator [Candidatus Acidoferrales bacterium]
MNVEARGGGRERLCYIGRMVTARAAGVLRLRRLKNISWLTKRQLDRVVGAMTVNVIEKRSVIFDDRHAPELAYILLSGVARITCRNRKGERTTVTLLAPGMIPGFPLPASGIDFKFRCETVSECRIGSLDLNTFIEIALGIGSSDFKRMAQNYSGRWDLVQLRCSNFMGCSLEERLALILLELSENFGEPEGKRTRLTVAARHKDLAEMVGASRPRITEHLIGFERRHLIQRDNHHWVVRRDRLEAFLASARGNSSGA